MELKPFLSPSHVLRILETLQRFVSSDSNVTATTHAAKWAEAWDTVPAKWKAEWEKVGDASTAVTGSHTAAQLLKQVYKSKARVLVICLTAQVIVAECRWDSSSTQFSLHICKTVFDIGEIPFDGTAQHWWSRDSSESMVSLFVKTAIHAAQLVQATQVPSPPGTSNSSPASSTPIDDASTNGESQSLGGTGGSTASKAPAKTRAARTQQTQQRSHCNLFCAYGFFAHGSVSEVYFACITQQRSEEYCPHLLRVGRFDHVKCPNASHLRVVAKGVRQCRLEDEEESPDLIYSLSQLEQEAQLYRDLATLQGSALPLFHGRWHVRGESFFVYEDVGPSVSEAIPRQFGVADLLPRLAARSLAQAGGNDGGTHSQRHSFRRSAIHSLFARASPSGLRAWRRDHKEPVRASRSRRSTLQRA